MLTLGTALRTDATRVMLLGSGELGKEVAIECQRLGLEVIAVDRYANAPAMQVAHRSHVISMLDGAALRTVIEKERPDLVVPEIEAILIDRKDIASAGAGETPIMAVAPAIGNAIFDACGTRLNGLPLAPNGLKV